MNLGSRRIWAAIRPSLIGIKMVYSGYLLDGSKRRQEMLNKAGSGIDRCGRGAA